MHRLSAILFAIVVTLLFASIAAVAVSVAANPRI